MGESAQNIRKKLPGKNIVTQMFNLRWFLRGPELHPLWVQDGHQLKYIFLLRRLQNFDEQNFNQALLAVKT